MSLRHLIRTLGLALIAVLAVSAVAVASASAALPEFRQGGVELKKVVQLTGSGGASTLETVATRTVKCKGNTATGELTGGKTAAKVVVTFTECEGPSSTECGTIKTAAMSGSIGYVAGTENGVKKVGIKLEAEKAGEAIAKFNCELLGNGSKIAVTGHVICQLKPLNKEEAKGEIICNQTAGVQEFTKFEGEAGTLALSTSGEAIGFFGEGFAAEQSGQQSTGPFTLKEAVELKA